MRVLTTLLMYGLMSVSLAGPEKASFDQASLDYSKDQFPKIHFGVTPPKQEGYRRPF